MTLAIDIGNSNIVIAIHHAGQWTNSFRYETKEIQPEFFYESALRNIFLEWNIHFSDIKQSVISSVVPDLNDIIIDAVQAVTGLEPLLITSDVIKTLDIPIPHPYEIGSDLVANAYAAVKSYYKHCIIVDFGTALTFTIVNIKDGIIGVTIMPGIKTAIHSLSSQTAQLPMVPLELPPSVIGHDTVTAIQSGVLWGYVGMVKEILRKMKEELTEPHKVIATGGLSAVLHPLAESFDIVDKMLTLEGMRLIYDHTLSQIKT